MILTQAHLASAPEGQSGILPENNDPQMTKKPRRRYSHHNNIQSLPTVNQAIKHASAQRRVEWLAVMCTFLFDKVKNGQLLLELETRLLTDLQFFNSEMGLIPAVKDALSKVKSKREICQQGRGL
jgi:hypothetical protein